MKQNDILPQRRTLPHGIPSWIRQGARHFVTINCRERHADILCRPDVAAQLLRSARHYEETARWHLWLLVVMPDHLHMIATFDLERGLGATVRAWKGFQAKRLHIDWQAGYFEHRLRDDAEFIEKMHYVRMNPVRRGLVNSPAEWPHILDRSILDVG